MAFLNNSALDTALQSDIDALTTASDSCCLLIPGLKYCTNVQNSLVDLAKLPNICTQGIPNGQLVFAKAKGITAPVVASNCEWIGLDGKVFRYDHPRHFLWSWGYNNVGQLGDITTVNKSSPVRVGGGFGDWCQVSAGNNHTAAIRTNGTLWTWGSNGFGTLGNNSTANCSSPVSVVGGFTNWCQVSASPRTTAAIRTNGTLWTWGWNSFGQLGDNTNVNKQSPVSVVGGFTDWCQVSVGFTHTAAIRTNGTLWTWGSNYRGVLGNQTSNGSSTSSPVSVIGGFTDWCQVSASDCANIAIRTNGTLWTWGLNSYGQLGDNTQIDRSSPVGVVGEFTDWCQVSAGSRHTAAVRSNGTLWTWGNNSFGQLGNNSAGFGSCKLSPVSVVGGFTDWCQVSAGTRVTSAIRADGTIWTWGYNSFGQLGDNTLVSKSSPVSVVGNTVGWSRVSTGLGSVVAILVK